MQRFCSLGLSLLLSRCFLYLCLPDSVPAMPGSALSASHAAFLFIPQSGNCLKVSALLRGSISTFRLVCSFVSPFVVIVSPFSLVFPFVPNLVSLLVGHCVRLVSLLFRSISLLASLLAGYSVRLVSLCLWFCLPSSWLLCPPYLPSVSFCFLPSFGHCVRLVSLLSPFLFPFLFSLAILHISLPRLSCCVRLCHSLHLSPSSGLLCPPLPCNPLHVSRVSFVSPLVGHCVRLVSLLSFFVSGLLVVSVLSPFVSLLVFLFV